MKTKNVVTVIVIIVVVATVMLMSDYIMNGGNDKIYQLGIWKQTPAWNLALAVKHQQVSNIERILRARPELLNYQEPKFGATLLIWSVGTEKYKSAEALLKCGADPNIQTTWAGETALYVAAGYSWVDRQAKDDPQYVKLLLKYGADPNINYIGFTPTDGSLDITEPGTSPLMRSIGFGIEKTKALVEGGADINYKTASGRTAAIEALIAVPFYASEEEMNYPYYLIVVKKARISDPYYRGERFTGPGDDPNVKLYPVDLLRQLTPDAQSREYQMKMDIVKEFKRQGVDY